MRGPLGVSKKVRNADRAASRCRAWTGCKLPCQRMDGHRQVAIWTVQYGQAGLMRQRDGQVVQFSREGSPCLTPAKRGGDLGH